MNRRGINNIINKILPVSSSVIGSPRRSAVLKKYLDIFPENGSIDFCKEPDLSTGHSSLPEFFNPHRLETNYATFIACLKQSRVWGRNGAVIAAGDYFIKDVSREFNEGMNIGHSVYYTIRQKKYRSLKGNIAVIGTAGANVYYHWMLDILPRLALISKKFPLDDISNFITEFTNLPFQIETLSKAGIPVNKIIPSNENWAFHLKAETLYVPSLPGPLGQPNRFQINYLKNLYNENISRDIPFRKLYISRKKTGRRRIVNEEELLNILLRFQFEIIECEELNVLQQVKLFSESAIIIGSHGSAFTNLVFCKPGTVVIDIFNETHINPCFWMISDILSLNYHHFSGVSVALDDNPKNDNTLVNINLFKMLLREIGLQ